MDETSWIILDKFVIEVEALVESVTIDEDKLDVLLDKLDETSWIILDKLVAERDDDNETGVTKLEPPVNDDDNIDKFDDISLISLNNKTSRLNKVTKLPSNAIDNEYNVVDIEGVPYIFNISFDKLLETSWITFDKFTIDVEEPVESVTKDEDKL